MIIICILVAFILYYYELIINYFIVVFHVNPHRAAWRTVRALNSDHLPIQLTIQTDSRHTIQQNRRSYTNYRKADWDRFTRDTEDAFAALQPPTDVHDAGRTFTNILCQAGRRHMPVGRIRDTGRFLPQPIRYRIEHRNLTGKTRHKIPVYRS